jgi:hypothetical protein
MAKSIGGRLQPPSPPLSTVPEQAWSITSIYYINEIMLVKRTMRVLECEKNCGSQWKLLISVSQYLLSELSCEIQ